MPKELREEDKRHPGTIQMHGTGMPKLVWMYSFWHFRTSPPCHFTIFFHKEINGIGGHSAFATMMRCKEKIVITLPLLGRMCFIQISFEQFNHRGGDWNYSQFISLSSKADCCMSLSNAQIMNFASTSSWQRAAVSYINRIKQKSRYPFVLKRLGCSKRVSNAGAVRNSTTFPEFSEQKYCRLRPAYRFCRNLISLHIL